MKKNLLFVLAVFMGILFVFASGPGAKLVNINMNDLDLNSKPQDIKPGSGVKPDIDFGRIPLYFIFNQGQVNKKAKYYTKASGYSLWLTGGGLVFDSIRKVEDGKQTIDDRRQMIENRIHLEKKFVRDVSRLIFLNANKNPEMVPVEVIQLEVNYFIGNDKSKWNCDVPTSMAVLYKSLYKNIDLKVYGIEKEIEYDWIVKPGGNPGDIRFRYKNVKGTRIDEKGNLLI